MKGNEQKNNLTIKCEKCGLKIITKKINNIKESKKYLNFYKLLFWKGRGESFLFLKIYSIWKTELKQINTITDIELEI